MQHCLKFNGCPVFYGTYEECVKKMQEDYPGRQQRFCKINSPEQLKELAESKMINSATMAHHRQRSFSQDGNVEYYD